MKTKTVKIVFYNQILEDMEIENNWVIKKGTTLEYCLTNDEIKVLKNLIEDNKAQLKEKIEEEFDTTFNLLDLIK